MPIVTRLENLWTRSSQPSHASPSSHGTRLVSGYARVSTPKQKFLLQVDALRDAGCDLIFREVASGRKSPRQKLSKAVAMCRSGDLLVVWSLDRLSRLTEDVNTIVTVVRRRGAEFCFLNGGREGISTATPEGRLLISVLACMAEFEVSMTSARTRAGMKSAGVRLPPRLAPTFNGRAARYQRAGSSSLRAGSSGCC
jgi:predicted site-specific integrase-resolvase